MGQVVEVAGEVRPRRSGHEGVRHADGDGGLLGHEARGVPEQGDGRGCCDRGDGQTSRHGADADSEQGRTFSTLDGDTVDDS